MGEVVPLFDPERWARRWVAYGGCVRWDGVHWPVQIFFPPEHHTHQDRELRRMFDRTGPKHWYALQAWARDGGHLILDRKAWLRRHGRLA